MSSVVRANDNGVAEIEVDSGDYSHNIFAVSNYHAGTVKVFIRPEDIILILSENRGESSARNVMKGRI